MLPPGIFLWKTSEDPSVSELDIPSLSELHPAWAADLKAYGPWEVVHRIDEVGEFIQGSASSEATLVVARQCYSTMESARLLAERRVLGEWGAVLGVEQTGGRGQLRRPWISPPGNLHISVILPSAPSSGSWSKSLESLRPLVAGYISSVVLAELGAELKIKWPNDLLQENHKVGGMLIEERDGVAILGIGINLVDCPSDYQMRDDHSVSAGILQTNQSNLSPIALGDVLVNRGKNVYVVLLDEFPPARFVMMLENHLAWFGQEIEVREGGGESYQAMIKGLSPDGGLVVRCRGKESVLFSGSIFPL